MVSGRVWGRLSVPCFQSDCFGHLLPVPLSSEGRRTAAAVAVGGGALPVRVWLVAPPAGARGVQADR